MPTAPKVQFLASPSADKSARAALNGPCLFITELPDGSIVLGDRSQSAFIVLDEMPTRDQLRLYRDLINTARMSAEARFYGEPDTRQLASDLRSSRQPINLPRASKAQAIDIDL